MAGLRTCEVKKAMPNIECTMLPQIYWFISDKKFGEIMVCKDHWDLLCLLEVASETRKRLLSKELTPSNLPEHVSNV